jgi:hypothetical protein
MLECLRSFRLVRLEYRIVLLCPQSSAFESLVHKCSTARAMPAEPSFGRRFGKPTVDVSSPRPPAANAVGNVRAAKELPRAPPVVRFQTILKERFPVTIASNDSGKENSRHEL